jgi:hypothetical protein
VAARDAAAHDRVPTHLVMHNALEDAVGALRLTRPEMSAKQVEKELSAQAQWANVSPSDMKRAYKKVRKAASKQPAMPLAPTSQTASEANARRTGSTPPDWAALKQMTDKGLIAYMAEHASDQLRSANVLCMCNLHIQERGSAVWQGSTRDMPLHLHAAFAEETNKIKTKFVRGEVVPQIVSLLSAHRASLSVNDEGVSLLSNLSAGNLEHKKAVVDGGGLPAVAMTWRAFSSAMNHRLLSSTIALLCNLSGDFTAGVHAIDGVAIIQEGLQSPLIDSQLKDYAMYALTSTLRTHSFATGKKLTHIEEERLRQATQDTWDAARADQAMLRPHEGFDNLGKACAKCGALPQGWPPHEIEHNLSTGEMRPVMHTYPPEVPDTFKNKFKTCARCRLVSYCSPECQRTAWKHAHKHSCGRPLPVPTDVPSLDQTALVAGLKEFGTWHAGVATLYSTCLVCKLRTGDEEALPGAEEAIEAASRAFPFVADEVAMLRKKAASNATNDHGD